MKVHLGRGVILELTSWELMTLANKCRDLFHSRCWREGDTVQLTVPDERFKDREEDANEE